MNFEQLKTLEKIIENPGQYVRDFNESDFGKHVITGPQLGNKATSDYVGKLVQVRKKSGIYGGDCVFLRHPDNKLCTHENQFFFWVKEEYISFLDNLFKENTSDSIEATYTIKNEFPEIGFIIPEKIKEEV